MLNEERVLRRGEVYWANLPKKDGSRSQYGRRPIIILSNNFNNKHCDFVHYAPITHVLKRTDLPVHILIKSPFLPVESMVLCEQADKEDQSIIMEWIDWEKGCIGRFPERDMIRINMGVMAQFNIDMPTIRFYIQMKNQENNRRNDYVLA